MITVNVKFFLLDRLCFEKKISSGKKVIICVDLMYFSLTLKLICVSHNLMNSYGPERESLVFSDN